MAAFLSERLDSGTGGDAVLQMEQVADFYETTELAPTVRAALAQDVPAIVAGRKMPVRDVQRGAALARMLAKLGNAQDVAFAKTHYIALVAFAQSTEDFVALVQLHDVLGLGADAALLRRRIAARQQEVVDQQLGAAEKAHEVKQTVLQISDRKVRIEEEIKMYLTLDYGFMAFLQPWSARRLRRESWAEQPSAQLARPDPAPLRADVAAAFRAFLPKIAKLKDLEPDERDSYRLRLLRAVVHFGGDVSKAERAFLKKNATQQADVLADEGFLIAPKVAALARPYVVRIGGDAKQVVTITERDAALQLSVEGFGPALTLSANEGGASTCRVILEHHSDRADVSLSLAIPDERARCKMLPSFLTLTLPGREAIEEAEAKRTSGNDGELRAAALRMLGAL